MSTHWRRMAKGLGDWRGAGLRIIEPYFLALLSESCLRAGRIETARFQVLDDLGRPLLHPLQTLIEIQGFAGSAQAAAEALEAPVLYSEDLSHGQYYGSTQVINPFLNI